MFSKSIEEIKPEVKKLIVATLNFENVRPEDILDDKNFFSGENIIKIDSIDVLELVVAIQKQFDVRINDQNLARNIISDVNTIAEFVYAQQHNYAESKE
jgi:acyl carrier protein